MSSIIPVIENITGFMTYFVPGYIFLFTFCYASSLPLEKQIEYLIIKCISLSYILFTVSQFIGRKNNSTELGIQIICFILAAASGCILGSLHRSQLFKELSSIFFNRDPLNDFFVNVSEYTKDDDVAVFTVITLKDNKGICQGQLGQVMSINNTSALQLEYYEWLSADSTIICDQTNTDNAGIVILYSDIERLEYEIVPYNNQIEDK